MNSVTDRIPKLAIASLATVSILTQNGTGQAAVSNELQYKSTLNRKMPSAEYISSRYGIMSNVEIIPFNSDIENFIDNDENFKNFIIDTLNKLQKNYVVFGSSLEISNDPSENHSQLRINIFSMDDDKFEKYLDFIDSWSEEVPYEYLDRIVIMVA